MGLATGVVARAGQAPVSAKLDMPETTVGAVRLDFIQIIWTGRDDALSVPRMET